MAESNFDYAMRRYNQSWLLNPNNYQPYWGFARVAAEQGKIDEAMLFLEKAKALINDPYQEVALLLDMGTIYSTKAESLEIDSPSRKKYFNKANEQFKASIALEDGYGPTYRRWAFSLYEQGRYKEAWEKMKKARALKAKSFPNQFIDALSAKMPQPQ